MKRGSSVYVPLLLPCNCTLQLHLALLSGSMITKPRKGASSAFAVLARVKRKEEPMTASDSTELPSGGNDCLSAKARRFFLAGVALYVCLFGFNSLARMRNFSPDSIGYVDAARNMVAGHGFSTSIHTVEELEALADARRPAPLTIWPPLYPLLVAALSMVGLSAPDAALVVTVLSGGLILLATYLLARTLFDELVACASVAVLLVCGHFVRVVSFAWSEPTAIACALFSLFFMVRPREKGGERIWAPLLAGLFAGLAFATRYGMLPLAVVGVVAQLERKDAKRTAASLALFLGGFLVLAGPVVGRNLALSGHLLGPPRPPSDRGLLRNLFDLYASMASYWLPRPVLHGLLQVLLFWVAAIYLGVRLCRKRFRHAFRAAFREVTCDGRRGLLALWFAGYLIFIIWCRTRVYLDPLGPDPRLVSPATIPLAILVVALAVAASEKWRGERLVRLAFVLLGLGLMGHAAAAVLGKSVADCETRIGGSERLTWIAENTTGNNLIIGQRVAAVPFCYPGRHVINFYRIPFPEKHLRYDAVMDYVRNYRDQYDQAFLIIWKPPKNVDWDKGLGPFITDIVQGRLDPYPSITALHEVGDGYIFELRSD